MASQEERLLILKMIDEGKISADEGARLLAAMRPAAESSGNSNSTAPGDSDSDQANAKMERESVNKPEQDGIHINVANVNPTEDGRSTLRERGAKNVRVRVTDPDTDQERVDINVPLKIVEFGMRFLPETNDTRIEKVRSAVYTGKAGSIMNIKDDNDMTRVEVSLE